jgi:ATP-binding cassette subfamily F protein 3
MPVAVGTGLARSFGADEVFGDVSFEIQERDRIALVGVNGSGKSTLLRILAGLDRPDRGSIALRSGTRVGYLPQEVAFPAGQTLREYVLEAIAPLLRLEAELRAVEADLARVDRVDGAAGGAGSRVEALLARHERLLHEFEYNGGYTYQNRLREVLAGLGIAERRLDQPLEAFSGGERTRAGLARLLLARDDLLLLDEPTNHLDLAATEWLETFLAQAAQAIVLVSHDRYLIDKVATRVWELGFGRLEAYTGNYSRFAVQRAERQARLQNEYEAQQRHIARTEAFIRRYRAGQRSREARGRQKQLDRLERMAPQRRPEAIKLAIQSTLRSGEVVLATEDLVVAAGTPRGQGVRVAPGLPAIREPSTRRLVPQEALLFRCPDLELRRGERAAMVGPNGSGKTTFLRIVTGEVEPAAGRVYVGYGVQIAYYAQAHEQLDLGKTVLEEILDVQSPSSAYPAGQYRTTRVPQRSVPPAGTENRARGSEEAARTYLGRFLFTGDDVFKPVGSLSGGERSRLALAKLALGNANLLVLDEPTNHLDIYSREALEDVLASFAGTILFVSHDRYLIDGLATEVWEVADRRLTVHKGTWSDYLDARERAAAERAAAEAAARTAAAAPDVARAQAVRAREREVAARRERLGSLESEIAAGEAELQALAAQLEHASAEADTARIADLGRRHAALAAEVARLEHEWIALHASLEAAGEEPAVG